MCNRYSVLQRNYVYRQLTEVQIGRVKLNPWEATTSPAVRAPVGTLHDCRRSLSLLGIADDIQGKYELLAGGFEVLVVEC
jgi:hypothetical protein